MKAYEISGTKGTYLELEDGRVVDTVSGYLSDGDGKVQPITDSRGAWCLRDWHRDVTDFVDAPLCTDWTAEQAARYVGAD